MVNGRKLNRSQALRKEYVSRNVSLTSKQLAIDSGYSLSTIYRDRKSE